MPVGLTGQLPGTRINRDFSEGIASWICDDMPACAGACSCGGLKCAHHDDTAPDKCRAAVALAVWLQQQLPVPICDS